jgi:aspartyl-tRNA(Asn)/glutamyl-tRNA(Gln) amidotransferase subunit C
MTTSQPFPCAPVSAQPIDQQTIERLATLARIRLTAEETGAVEEHLRRMFSYIEKLREVNTEGIEPMAHAVDVAAPLRADEVTNQPNTEGLLQNAPACSGEFFVVPRIIE